MFLLNETPLQEENHALVLSWSRARGILSLCGICAWVRARGDRKPDSHLPEVVVNSSLLTWRLSFQDKNPQSGCLSARWSGFGRQTETNLLFLFFLSFRGESCRFERLTRVHFLPNSCVNYEEHPDWSVCPVFRNWSGFR